MPDGLHHFVPANTATATAPAPTHQISKARPSGPKVLIIDDSRVIRRAAEIVLMQAGYEVLLAEDGFDALEKLSAQTPDLIFVDVLMPRLDGYQTCALIKRSDVYRHIPVVMLTSKDNLFDRARGHSVGSSQYLTKPFNKEMLLRTVEAHVPMRHGEPAHEPGYLHS